MIELIIVCIYISTHMLDVMRLYDICRLTVYSILHAVHHAVTIHYTAIYIHH